MNRQKKSWKIIKITTHAESCLGKVNAINFFELPYALSIPLVIFVVV